MTITLERDNGRNLKFVGEELAYVSSQSHQGSSQNRWTELTLYRTDSGKYVLRRVYVTQWEGEHGSRDATAYESAKALVEGLEARYGPDCDKLGTLDAELLREAAKDSILDGVSVDGDAEIEAAMTEQI